MLGINLNNLKLNLLSFRSLVSRFSVRIFKFPRRNFSPACCAHVESAPPPYCLPLPSLAVAFMNEFWRPFCAACAVALPVEVELKLKLKLNTIERDAQHPPKVYQKSSAQSMRANSCGLELVACACRSVPSSEQSSQPASETVSDPVPPPKKPTHKFKFKFQFEKETENKDVSN